MARAMGVSLSSAVSAPTCAMTDASMEQYMTWAEIMRGNAEVASRDQGRAGDEVANGTQSASWEPYDVWLTRVKQPRERAAQVLTGNDWQHNWRQA